MTNAESRMREIERIIRMLLVTIRQQNQQIASLQAQLAAVAQTKAANIPT